MKDLEREILYGPGITRSNLAYLKASILFWFIMSLVIIIFSFLN